MRKLSQSWKSMDRNRKMFWGILLLAILTRFLWIGNIPGNGSVNQDEAYAGYEAWSILHYGQDSWGYTMPVYMTTWGSGMSALQVYLMIPWVAIFGLTSFAIRLPQAIHGVLTIVAFYFFARKIRGEKFALTAMALLTIVPWHIMISRWAYDCNYLPGCIVYALLFLVLGTERPWFLLLSGLMFGICLYAYAAAWVVMPFFILICVIWLLAVKKLKFSKQLVLFFVLLFATALPLILFVAVNMGLIEEIVTPWISIPKMPVFRSSDYGTGIKSMISNFLDTVWMLIHQEDGRTLNSIGELGIYYKITMVPFLIGISGFFYDWIHRKAEASKLEMLVFVQFLCGLILGATLEEPLIHRVNIIHIPIIYFAALGIYDAILYFGKAVKYGAVVIYGACLLLFTMTYTVEYDSEVAAINHDGISYAMDYADSVSADTIYVLADINYIYCVFNEQIPTDEFIETFHQTEDQLWVGNIECELTDYHDAALESGCVYLCDNDNAEVIAYMQEAGMKLQYFNTVVVGYLP